MPLTAWVWFGVVDDTELAVIEKELCRLPAVNAARIVADEIGRPKELHILASAEKSPKQIARDVQSVAMATFGMEIDHRIISVVQLDQGHLEPILAPVGRARVSIGAISSEQRGMRNHARVMLNLGGEESVGLAEGSIAESSAGWEPYTCRRLKTLHCSVFSAMRSAASKKANSSPQKAKRQPVSWTQPKGKAPSAMRTAKRASQRLRPSVEPASPRSRR